MCEEMMEKEKFYTQGLTAIRLCNSFGQGSSDTCICHSHTHIPLFYVRIVLRLATAQQPPPLGFPLRRYTTPFFHPIRRDAIMSASTMCSLWEAWWTTRVCRLPVLLGAWLLLLERDQSIYTLTVSAYQMSGKEEIQPWHACDERASYTSRGMKNFSWSRTTAWVQTLEDIFTPCHCGKDKEKFWLNKQERASCYEPIRQTTYRYVVMINWVLGKVPCNDSTSKDNVINHARRYVLYHSGMVQCGTRHTIDILNRWEE